MSISSVTHQPIIQCNEKAVGNNWNLAPNIMPVANAGPLSSSARWPKITTTINKLLDIKHFEIAKEKSLGINLFAAENLDIKPIAAKIDWADWVKYPDIKHFEIAKEKPLGINFFAAENLDIKPIAAKIDGADWVKYPDINPNEAPKAKPLNILNAPMCAANLQISRNRLIVARPLRELGAHLKNRKLPSLGLVTRAIKTLALSIFRWHLCDCILLEVENSIFHSLKGRVEMSTCEKFKKDYSFLYDNAFKYEFIPSYSLTETQIKTMKQINAQTIVELCKRCGDIALTAKEKGNKLSDLFKSKQLKHCTQ